MRHGLEASSLPYGWEGATGICLLISHTGIDLESIEEVILSAYCSAGRSCTLPIYDTFIRVVRVLIYIYISMFEMRPTDSCVTTYISYVVVCCLETTALHCLVALCWCPCLTLAVLGRFWAFLSRFSVRDDVTVVTSWGSASGQSAKQAGVSFCDLANCHKNCLFFWQFATELGVLTLFES